jgi:hypothetical protein
MKSERKTCFALTYGNVLPACTPTQCKELGYSEGTPCVQDPVQGAIGDCYIIAALASVAWAASSRLGNYANGYKFGRDTAATRLPDKNLALNSSNQPCYARLGPRNVLWPLFYERAYAKWRGCADPDCKNMGCISGGAGIKGLEDLTGWPSRTLAIGSWNQVPCTNGKANVPAVTWTDGRALPTNIIPSHTYSYLGYYPATNPGWVVLRNPYGSLRPEPTTNVNTGNTEWHKDSCVTINFNNTSDGIFALDIPTFTSKFAGIGYVTDR